MALAPYNPLSEHSEEAPKVLMIYEKLNQGSRSPLHTSPLLEKKHYYIENSEGIARRLARTRQELIEQLKDRFPGLPF